MCWFHSCKFHLDDLDDEDKWEGEREDDEDQGEHGQGHGAHTRALLAAWKYKLWIFVNWESKLLI